MSWISKYFWNILIAIDQFANTVLAGDPDETMSSRFGKWKTADGWRREVAYVVCRCLHWIDKGHCEKSIEADEGDRTIL
jgi:hypothetical protein